MFQFCQFAKEKVKRLENYEAVRRKRYPGLRVFPVKL